MTVYHHNRRPEPLIRYVTVLALIIMTSLITLPVAAGAEDPYPEFVANYLVRVNGIKVGKATFSLQREGADEYLYQQHTTSSGVAALLGFNAPTRSSRWRYVDGEIQPLEYRSKRKNGDDDDNAHLFFDWKTMRVTNRGAGEQWDIELPEGTLDKLIMQLAMLFDLREGKTKLNYAVATDAHIKHYRFEVTGRDTIELPFGNYDAIRAERKDDKKDRSLVWGAPELNYFPIRFLKQKKAGLEVEILLQKLDFNPRLAKDTPG